MSFQRGRQVNFFQSIRFYMLILVILGAIPYCAILVSNAYESRNDNLEDMKNQSKAVVLSISAQHDALVSGAQQLLETLSYVPDIREKNPAKSTDLLKAILRDNAQYGNILLADENGLVVASAMPFKPSLSIADRKFYRDAIRTKRFSPGEYIIGRTAIKPLINFGYPVMDSDGKMIAILALGLDLSYMRNLYEKLTIPDGGNAAIVDHKGVVLNRINEPEKYVGKSAQPESFAIMRDGQPEGTFTGLGIDGETKFFYYKKIFAEGSPEPYAYVLATFPEQFVVKKLDQKMFAYIAQFGLILIASILGILLVAKYKIGNKVKILVDVIESHAAGAPAGKASDKVRDGEFALIAEAFDKMNAKLLEQDEERRSNMELLQESEGRFRNLFNQASDSILLLEFHDGPTPIIREMNDVAATRLGYSREELIGKPITFIDPDPTFVDNNQKRVEEIDATGGSIFEVEHRTKTGEIRRFECNTKAFESGGIRMILSAERDITERRQAESEILALTQRLDLALRSANIGIWDWNIITNEMLWDDRMIELYGYTRDTFPGGFEGWQRGVHPDDMARAEEELQAAMRGEKDWDIELRTLHPDGTVKHLKAYGMVLRDESGKPVRMLGINFDITPIKAAEEEKEKLQEQLVQSQKLESIGKLAGGVAHDFNNMLGVILGHSELLLEHLDKDSPLREDIEEIRDAASRSADITRQLLAFARKQTISPKVLNLNDALPPTLKMIKRLIGEDVELSWKPGPELWKVKIDPSQLDQILANLATNARDAITGIGHLTIETENISVDRHYVDEHHGFATGKYVVLSVSDDGVGIEREKLASIFEPFFTTKALGKGTGLGLSTVYGIVKQNGGFINVYSEPGDGATFRIYLPRVEEMRMEEEATETKASGGSETILAVEDEPASLKILHRFLTSLGYHLMVAGSPTKALELAKEADNIDLLITDVVMPEMNGKQLSEELKRLIPNLKCLFMSGYTANVIAHRGILDEGIDFIQKPFGLNDIAAKVRKILDS